MRFYKIGFGTDKIQGVHSVLNALKAGIKHIDTAESYLEGKSEEYIGEAIRGINRDDLFVASKIHGNNLGYADVLKSCEQSLGRLGIDRLDLCYIHYPNVDIPFEETARGFNALLSKGLIKNIGICNATIETIQKYQKYLSVPFFAVQCQYNLIAREPAIKGVIDYCAQNNIRFIGWRCMQPANALLKIESLTARGVYPLLDEMADKYGKTNAQIAVKWVTQQNNVHTIFKSESPKHIQEILDTNGFELSDEDMRALSDNFPRQEKTGFIAAGYRPLV
ncbi:MAG: aldo/keto reductase [Lactobacillales bacterium]|jgi:diketogulonate reductase-like aldo/keto reductase|nr:aldo/keto reductase [Lactobacillales bacterium]